MNRPAAPDGRESGFSLVEVVVAMVLLGILSLAFLPLVLRATTAAASATTLATATRLVSKQLELRRAEVLLGCPALGSSVRVDTVTDPRGAQLEAWATFVGPCSAPGVVRYDVRVIRSTDAATPLATATTLLPVRVS